MCLIDLQKPMHFVCVEHQVQHLYSAQPLMH